MFAISQGRPTEVGSPRITESSPGPAEAFLVSWAAFICRERIATVNALASHDTCRRLAAPTVRSIGCVVRVMTLPTGLPVIRVGREIRWELSFDFAIGEFSHHGPLRGLVWLPHRSLS